MALLVGTDLRKRPRGLGTKRGRPAVVVVVRVRVTMAVIVVAAAAAAVVVLGVARERERGLFPFLAPRGGALRDELVGVARSIRPHGSTEIRASRPVEVEELVLAPLHLGDEVRAPPGQRARAELPQHLLATHVAHRRGRDLVEVREPHAGRRKRRPRRLERLDVAPDRRADRPRRGSRRARPWSPQSPQSAPPDTCIRPRTRPRSSLRHGAPCSSTAGSTVAAPWSPPQKRRRRGGRPRRRRRASVPSQFRRRAYCFGT